MKRKPTFTSWIGSICTAGRTESTPEDTIGDLAYELKSLLHHCRVDREVRKAHVALVNEASGLDMDADEGLFDGETDIIARLVEALDHYAPPYTYFGKNSEAEYGFWPDLDLHSCDEPARIEAGLEHKEYWGGEDVALVNDHGNVSCGRFDKRGRFHSYWSAV